MAKLLNAQLRGTSTKGLPKEIPQETPQEIHEKRAQEQRRRSTFFNLSFPRFFYGGSKSSAASEQPSSKPSDNTTNGDGTTAGDNEVMEDVENLLIEHSAEQEGDQMSSEEVQPSRPTDGAFQTLRDSPEGPEDPISQMAGGEGEVVGNKTIDNDVSPTAHSSTPTQLSRPTVRHTVVSKKRKIETRDPYEVPEEGEASNANQGTSGEDNEYDEPQPPAKRSRAAKVKQAKMPLTRPKTSKGTASTYRSLKNNNNNNGADRVEEEPEREPEQTNGQVEPKPKKGPGRPRKMPTQVKGDVKPAIEISAQNDIAGRSTETNSEIQVAMGERANHASTDNRIQSNLEIAAANHSSGNGVSASTMLPVIPHPVEEDNSHNAEDPVGGVSSILLDPSPKKPPHMPRQPANSFTMTNLRSDSEDVSEFRASSSLARSPQPEMRRMMRSVTAGQLIIDPEDLIDLRKTVKRIGSKVRGERRESMGHTESTKSAEGKTMKGILTRLRAAYVALRTAKDAHDPQMDVKVEEVSLLIGEVKVEGNRILTKRLGRPSQGVPFFDTKPTKSMLKDLYFVLLSLFVGVVKAGIEAHLDQESIEYPALYELAELVDLLRELVATALLQPKGAQPTGDYQLRKPTQHLLVILRKLCTRFWSEIKDRHSKQENLEKREREAEAEQSRHEEEQIAEEERSRRIRKNRKLQKIKLQRIFADPLHGRAMRAAAEKKLADEDARRSRYGSSRQVSEDNRSRASKWVQVGQNHDIDDDPFTDDDIERVEVFGKNNKQKDHRRPWTEEEQLLFADIMQAKQGMPPFICLSQLDRLTLSR